MNERIIKHLISENDEGSEKLEKLLIEVPYFSEVALKAQQIMSQSELDIEQLVKTLETDAALVGKILRIANSSFYGLEREISSLREACIVLGQNTLRNIILTAAVMDIVQNQRIDKVYYNQMMNHFIHTGMLARDMASRVGVNGDTAYIVGLLHDIGSLFIEVLLPVESENIRQLLVSNNESQEQVETDVLGFNHSEFSGEIARHWKLPEEICLPLFSHHDADDEMSALNVIIYVADKVSTFILKHDDTLDINTELSKSMLERLGFTEQTFLDYVQNSVTPEEAELPR